MADIDDFDLDPGGEKRPAIGGSQPPRSIDGAERSGLSFPIILSALVVVVAGGLGGLWYAFRSPVVKRPAPPPEATTSVSPIDATPAPAPSAAIVLPALDESDGLVRKLAAALSTHPEFARWLGQSALVRTLTAVVVNVVDGETPAPHLAFLKPKASTGAVLRGRRLVADGAAFEAYNAVAEVVVSLDGEKVAGTFDALEPLFDSAYRDLGHPEGGFRSALVRAIEILESTAVPGEDAALERHGTLLRYSDPRFEGLTPPQKQFLRMGPGNVHKIQGALTRLEPYLKRARR